MQHPSRRFRPIWMAVVVGALALAASAPEVAELAEEARSEPGAVAELEAVTEIDGVAVDMAGLLGEEAGRPQRLRALAHLLADEPRVDAAEVGRQVEEILADPSYADPREPFLERLLGPVYDWYQRMVAWLWDRGLLALRSLLSLLDLAVLAWLGPLILAAATVATALVLGRRRAREIGRRAAIERVLELGTDPATLEALAQDAEREARHSDAIRFRFVAGLLRLDGAGRIDFYPGLSNAAISDELGRSDFDELAEQFDRVVYGRRPATSGDARWAADRWARMLGTRV